MPVITPVFPFRGYFCFGGYPTGTSEFYGPLLDECLGGYALAEITKISCPTDR
jgi:hypothetical protein